MQSGLFAVVLFCASLTGCENYCFSGVVNGSNGTSSVEGATCPPAKPTGNINLRLSSALTPVPASVPLRVPHIFVTLRGIEALPLRIAGEDAPDWQELAPQLSVRPVQVDLTAQVADSCGPGPLAATAIPAGAYSQIRLLIVPNLPPDQPTTNEPALEENACGRFVFSCFVEPDAAVRPLVWDDPAELRVPPNQIAGGFFLVLPDRDIHLTIELDARSSIILAVGDALRLVPTFSVSEQSPCDPGESPRP